MEPDDRVRRGVVTIVGVLARGSGEWAVLTAADRNGQVIKLVGTTLGRRAEPGRQVRVEGRWREHPVHGPQLDVHHAAPVLQAAQATDDVYALLRRIPRMGDKRAQLLIDHFGAESVLIKVDANPRHAFSRVAGMPFCHAADAARWWYQHRKHPRRRGS